MTATSQQQQDVYTYDYLVSPACIRLCELLGGEGENDIHISLQQIELPEEPDSAPPYTALSYTWGPDRDKLPIWIDRKQFMVRPNLLAALRALRSTDRSTTLWIDAICINQDNVHEKNHQVSRMGRIYRAADTMRIWLGTVDEHTLRVSQYITDNNRSHDSPSNELTGLNAPVDAFDKMLGRDYWTRAWIVQEIMLASAIEVHFGNLKVPWEQLADACQKLRHSLSPSSAMYLIERRAAILDGRAPLLTQTLESLIRNYHQFQCQDSRDRIFAFLSLASDCASRQGIQPDYQILRLPLLVEVLEFCTPDDPIGFISMLLRALTREQRDAAWSDVALRWTSESQRLPIFSPSLVAVDNPPASRELIRVTYLVTASSSTQDWIRCHSLDAALDSQHVKCRAEQNDRGISKMIYQRCERAKSVRYHDRVCESHKLHLVVLLHHCHLVVISTSQLMAALSPCTILDLHPKHRGCTISHCAMLKLEAIQTK